MGSIVGSIAGGLVSGMMGSSAAKSAAQTQANTAAQQMQLQKEIFDIQNAQQAPYRAAGYTSLNTLGSMLPGTYTTYDVEGKPTGTATGTGYLTQQFGPAELATNLAPNYQWQLGQGQGANLAAANVGGGLIGGNALKGLQDYTQNFASNAYQNAFNNFQTQRGNIYNTLAGIAGIGQSAQQQSANLAQGYGTNVANLATGGAAAQAAGTVGAANALGGAFQNAGNMYTLGNLFGGGSTFGSGTSNAGGGISLMPSMMPASWSNIGSSVMSPA